MKFSRSHGQLLQKPQEMQQMSRIFVCQSLIFHKHDAMYDICHSFYYGNFRINGTKQLGTMMPCMTHDISFYYGKFHINGTKKARYHDGVYNMRHFVLFWTEHIILHRLAQPSMILLCLASSCNTLHHLASSCIILHHLASSCIILHRLASSCVVLHHLASSCIILYCLALSCIILHCLASSCIILHPLAPSCFVLHCLASSYKISHHLALSCIILKNLASSCIVLHHLAHRNPEKYNKSWRYWFADPWYFTNTQCAYKHLDVQRSSVPRCRV